MVNKITTPPTNNEVIDKINEIIDNLGGSTESFIPYGESTSAADAVLKEVTISSITSLSEGQIIIVKPTITSTVADATLKLNNFTAYPILYGTAAITTSTDSITWAAGYPSWFRFDGSNWVFLGHGVDNNTTYSAMSVSEGTTGTATTSRVVRADYLSQIIRGTKLTGLSTSTTGAVVATDTILVGVGKLQAQVNALPTVNNATLTIQKNGTNVATFTANASSNVTANISVPTNTNELTNGAGFITSSALSGYQTTANLVTSVSSSSTDSQYPSAKLFYDTVGDIVTLINAL